MAHSMAVHCSLCTMLDALLQVFVASKDGTNIPMFITHRRYDQPVGWGQQHGVVREAVFARRMRTG